ncbi:hypothetical protein BDV96DRAFT_632704 [Lophiotrema nucula]|uniref:Uncharacterized protein n=1 Tax=Lophiotrema nucula TaxID=690887 RepID=A0A6A5Z589_9PLEO|nr:hypothetical protein BDV96DRAFT_632704 [Lophiotrema nucula]
MALFYREGRPEPSLFREIGNTGSNILKLAPFPVEILTVEGLGDHVKEIRWSCAVGEYDTHAWYSPHDPFQDTDAENEGDGEAGSLGPPDELLANVLVKTPTITDLLNGRGAAVGVRAANAHAPFVSNQFRALKRISIYMAKLRLKDIGGILKLPSLREVQLRDVRQEDDRIDFETNTPVSCSCEQGASMVEHLIFEDPMIKSKALAQFLSCFKALRSYKFLFGEEQLHLDEYDWKSTHKIKHQHPPIAAALARHKDTLQTVHLLEGYEYGGEEEINERHEYDPGWLANLRSLKHVEELQIGVRAFASTTGTPALSPHLLPKVRTLTLWLEDNHDKPY